MTTRTTCTLNGPLKDPGPEGFEVDADEVSDGASDGLQSLLPSPGLSLPVGVDAGTLGLLLQG